MPTYSSLGRYHFIASLALLALVGCQIDPQAARPATTSGSQPATGNSAPMSPSLAAQIKAYEEAARLSDNPAVKVEAQFTRATTLYAAGRDAETIAAYQEFIAAWSGKDQELIPGYVTAATLNLGHVYKRQRRYDLAMKQYDEALKRTAGQTTLAARRHSTSGLLHKGESLIELTQYPAAMDTLRLALKDYCTETDPAREPNCARAQRSLGWAQQRSSQFEDALASYALVIEKHSRSSSVDVRQEVMIAHSRSGSVLVNPLKRYDEAMAAFDAALRLGMAMNTPQSRLWSAYSYLNKGNGLAVQGKRGEAFRVYDQIPASLFVQDEPGLIYPLVRSLLNKAQQMQGTQLSQALPVYDSALRQLSGPGGAEYPDLIAETHIARGRVLARLQRHDEAITAFDHVISRYGASTQSNLRDFASQAASAKAVAYDLKQRRDRLESRISEIDAKLREEDAKAEPGRSQGIVALNMIKASVYTGLAMYDEAASIYDSLLLRFGNSSDMTQRRAVVACLYLKGLLRQTQGQPFEAARTMRDVIERYGKEPDADIQRSVQQATDWLRLNQRAEPTG